MKIWISAILSGLMLVGGAAFVIAQSDTKEETNPPNQDQQNRPWMQRAQQGDQPGNRPMRRGMQGDNPRRRMMPAAIVTFIAIDVDKNGELSKEEIEGAAAVLKKLDLNADGKLTADEFRKAIPEEWRRKGPKPGGPNGPQKARGGRGQGRGPGQGQGRGQGPGPQNQP